MGCSGPVVGSFDCNILILFKHSTGANFGMYHLSKLYEIYLQLVDIMFGTILHMNMIRPENGKIKKKKK